MSMFVNMKKSPKLPKTFISHNFIRVDIVDCTLSRTTVTVTAKTRLPTPTEAA